jgi:hypothetical protein
LRVDEGFGWTGEANNRALTYLSELFDADNIDTTLASFAETIMRDIYLPWVEEWHVPKSMDDANRKQPMNISSFAVLASMEKYLSQAPVISEAAVTEKQRIGRHSAGFLAAFSYAFAKAVNHVFDKLNDRETEISYGMLGRMEAIIPETLMANEAGQQVNIRIAIQQAKKKLDEKMGRVPKSIETPKLPFSARVRIDPPKLPPLLPGEMRQAKLSGPVANISNPLLAEAFRLLTHAGYAYDHPTRFEEVDRALSSEVPGWECTDPNTLLIFSERATFEFGLGILLPQLAECGIRVAVVAKNENERELIEEMNSLIRAGNKIAYGPDITAIKADVNPVRYRYLKTAKDEPVGEDARFTYDITDMAKKIVALLGRACGVVSEGLIEKLHSATQKFRQAA